MNFDLSPEQHALRDAARRFLDQHVGFDDLRRRHEGGYAERFDRSLWRAMAGLGWLGAAAPEDLGGSGLGVTELCVLAEEAGRSLAPVPFVLSAGVVAEAIRCHGNDAQRRRWLPRLASGETVATFALAEGPGRTRPEQMTACYATAHGHLNGVKLPVPAAAEAQFALVACRADDAQGPVTLVLLDLQQAGVQRTALQGFDPFRTQARIACIDAAAEPLGTWPQPSGLLDAILDRAAILTAFEQIGGASACLDMARSYALERHVFARPIGSFQAIKHRLAEMAARIELARSNAWFAAWALEECDAGRPQAVPGGLDLAAATARISAGEAFDFASRENVQIHGGAGFTWEGNAHPFYSRARHLAVWLGGEPVWSARLVAALGREAA